MVLEAESRRSNLSGERVLFAQEKRWIKIIHQGRLAILSAVLDSMSSSSPYILPMSSPRHSSLTLWMSTSVAVFVLAGSLALLLVFQVLADREERAAFEALARANAAFLERTPLPQSDQMAAQLGVVMGARVFFWHASASGIVGKPGDRVGSEVMKLPADGRVHLMPDGEWMIGYQHRQDSRVFFLRPAPDKIIALNRPVTWGALGVFWLLSAALGIWLARRVTRPLRLLAGALPHLGTEKPLPVVPSDRRDEIGQLARALVATHQTLNDERERRRAAERLALLGRMTASLAHEVRNPVAAIQMHAQLLEGASPEEFSMSREIIESEAARIESLVGQWMSFAKPAPPVMSPVDVMTLVQEATRVMEPQAKHVGVEIHVNAPRFDSKLIVSADRHRLQQVLSNLLLNAIQAMPMGGDVRINVEANETTVRVIVEDEGAGFSAEALAKLGEPFYSEKEGGMGLGLAVSQEICCAHGGTLKVMNRDQGGARVIIELPSAPLALSP